MIDPGPQSGTAAQALPAEGHPSAGRIAAATGVALLVAAVVLVTAVLPAEYGIDLVGTGKLLGLVQLADARPGVLTAQPGEYRVDKIEFVLGPFESVEYKYRIEQGGSMLFSWQSTGLVVSELHSEPDGAPKGYAETFDKQQGTAHNGTYAAPFSGIHGWYWENVDKKDVRIILTTAGFYSKALEFSGGGTFDHEVQGSSWQPRSTRIEIILEATVMCARWLRAVCVVLLVFCGVGLGVTRATAQVSPLGPLNGALAGSIVDRDSGQAVAAATVTIEGRPLTASSNDGGRFRFDSLPIGPVSFVVSAPGFLDQRVEGIQISPRQTTLVGIQMQPTPIFTEQVVVSATKMPVSIGDIAAQASVVDRAEIERNGDQTLTQAINNTPGALVSTELGIFESVMLRGMPRDREFASTLLMIDGVPQTLSNGSARVNALTINDTSSIEVIRGPNSALYGRSAIGGSVNMRTADPTTTHQSGFDFTAGEFESVKGIFRAAGPILDWGGYYFSIAKEREGGYFVNKGTDDFVVGNGAFFGKFTFSVGSKTFGSLTVNRVNADSSTPTNEPIVDGVLLHQADPPFDRLSNFNLPGRNYQQNEGRLALNLTRQFTPTIKGAAVLGYRAVQHMFVEDGDFVAGPFNLEAHTATQFPFNQQTDEDIFYEELRVEMTPKLRNMKDSLVFGFTHEGNKGSSVFTDISVGEAFAGWPINYLTPVFPPREDWIETTSRVTYKLGVSALFGQYILEPTPRTLITAAGRFDWLNLEATRSSATTDSSSSAFSPKLSLTQRIFESSTQEGTQVNLYGAYSHAFVPPRRPSALQPEDAELDLQPENINNYEAGLKASVLDGKVALEATYFFMTEDGVVLDTREGALFRPTNAGEQRYRGLETGVNFAASPKFSVFANASFYHNRFGDFVIEGEDPADDEVLEGNRLPFSPDYIANFGTSFTLADSIDASVQVKLVGDVNSDRGNTFLVDAYSLLDAAVTYRRERFRITLSGHNLLNEESCWSGSTTSAESLDPGRPRQILVTTSVRFR